MIMSYSSVRKMLACQENKGPPPDIHSYIHVCTTLHHELKKIPAHQEIKITVLSIKKVLACQEIDTHIIHTHIQTYTSAIASTVHT